MNEINDGGPAFPEVPGECNVYQGKPGMTLRDYFAANAMRPLTLSMKSARDNEMLSMAREAYAIADAMLRARGAA
ncbi:hypothetical protein KDW39_08850 [Burkholderia multivorans]|uniref:hypothetical protein n=1 Tax=Burkholderia multivorans TaxID=87883 RepID=UPI001B9A81CA|nr:hypothetical protein [Burkholderia multivorans]MBR8123256.1 hypothetical protein [Burkholderia multivorans]MBU9600305.1 hypothetical protein [Burkholderia multivorans]